MEAGASSGARGSGVEEAAVGGATAGGVRRGKPEAAVDCRAFVCADCATSSSSRCRDARICESTASRHARAGEDCGMRR